MRMEQETSADFKTGAVKEVLRGITISEATGERLGVDPARLECWMRQLAERLDDMPLAVPRETEPFGGVPPGGRLSAGELRFLLDGYGQAAL